MSEVGNENIDKISKKWDKVGCLLTGIPVALISFAIAPQSIILLIILFPLWIIWVTIKFLVNVCRYIQIVPKTKMFISKLPKENYHILGYITFFYLICAILSEFAVYTVSYEVLRWMVFSFSLWTIHRIYKKDDKSIWLLIFGTISILFNPILKVTLHSHTWFIVDIITVIVCVIYAFKKSKINSTKER